MTAVQARLGPWFALTLTLPALFGAAWLWLVPGGLVERVAADERRAAEQLLRGAEAHLAAGLRSAAAAVPVLLTLDRDRRVVAPFAPFDERRASIARPATIAEQAAAARLAAGDHAAALPFFAHAAADGTLTPPGWLRYVAAQATTDQAAARRLLATARAGQRDVRCGMVPFDVLALLCEARLDRTAPARAQWNDEFAAALADVPAPAVPVVLDELVATATPFADARRLALRAAAAAAERHRTVAVPAEAAPGPGGSALVPIDAEHCAVVAADAVAAASAAAIAAATALTPELRIDEGGAHDATPARTIAALGAAWHAVATATPTSTLLGFAARTSLWLGLATLVLGNLLLWRLTRRESQLVRLRADFVDLVSHELRTPLAALSLKAEMLAADDVPAARRAHYLQGLHHDVRRLVDQVERILDFARVQRGATLRREVVPARTLLARGLRQGRPALRLVAQQLEVQADRDLPAVVGDLDVLGRALRNLLENAAKYAPPGSTVAVRAFAQGNAVAIEVADRGPGVPLAERGSIFEPFVRGGGATARTPGSGLGLALVAAAARSHDGRVTVHDRPGGGAIFRLQLPVPPRPRGEAAG